MDGSASDAGFLGIQVASANQKSERAPASDARFRSSSLQGFTV
jgi:hypothetical protein